MPPKNIKHESLFFVKQKHLQLICEQCSPILIQQNQSQRVQATVSKWVITQVQSPEHLNHFLACLQAG
jgi:hypothetical protein